MKLIRLLPLFLLLACLPPVEDHRADASRLVLMNLNAEFLWDGVAPEEGKIDFPWKGSREKAEAHMEDVAEIIQAHDPDVVQLAEVENRRALAEPADDLFNVSERLPRDRRYTNGRDAIDHILISPDLVPRLLDVEISHDHDPRTVTNHFPIIVHLRVSPGA